MVLRTRWNLKDDGLGGWAGIGYDSMLRLRCVWDGPGFQDHDL